MKLGVLADIHEHVRVLRRVIDALTRLGAERLVVLGDVFETGQRIEETVALLRDKGSTARDVSAALVNQSSKDTARASMCPSLHSLTGFWMIRRFGAEE